MKGGVKLREGLEGKQGIVKRVVATVNGGKEIDDDARGGSRQGYVVFKEQSKSCVDVAVETCNDHVVDGRRIKVDFADDSKRSTNSSETSLFVGNLPWKTDEESLRKYFEEKLGESASVKTVRVVRDPETLKCKGIGYVDVGTKEGVSHGLKIFSESGGEQVGEYKGKVLRVEVCGKRTKGARGASNLDPNAKKMRKRNETAENGGRKGQQAASQQAVAGGGGGGDRSHEGRRFASGSERRVVGKMKLKGLVSSKVVSVKKKRVRAVKAPETAGPSGKGIGSQSRRKASEKKVVDRVRKLEKRVAKGMGSQKKGRD